MNLQYASTTEILKSCTVVQGSKSSVHAWDNTRRPSEHLPGMVETGLLESAPKEGKKTKFDVFHDFSHHFLKYFDRFLIDFSFDFFDERSERDVPHALLVRSRRTGPAGLRVGEKRRCAPGEVPVRPHPARFHDMHVLSTCEVDNKDILRYIKIYHIKRWMKGAEPQPAPV